MSLSSRILPSLRRVRRAGAGALALALLVGTTGCFGAFPLTKAVYKFNGEASENEFVQTLVFWGFLFIPVYGVAMWVDAIVLNTIEFWSGEQIDLQAGVRDAKAETLADGSVRIRATDANGAEASIVLIPQGDGDYAVMGSAGRVGTVRRAENGDALLLSENGALIQRLPAAPARG